LSITAVAAKTLREAVREPQLLAVALACPVVLVLVYHAAFGQTDQGGLSRFLHLLVFDRDVGVEMPGGGRWKAGEELVAAIEDVRIDGQPAFAVRVVEDPDTADVLLRERRAAALLTIPEGFSRALLDARNGRPFARPATAILTGDPAADTTLLVGAILDDVVRAFGGGRPGWAPLPEIHTEALPGTDAVSGFEYGVSGVIVFGTLFLIITTATVVVRERTAGTLARLQMSRVGAARLLLGVALAQLAVAVVQVSLVFTAAALCGFRPAGSLPLAAGITLLLSVGAVGLGLLVAAVARNDVDAVNLGSAVAVPVALLSGSLMPMPELPVLAVAGRTVEAFDFLPASHGVEAMRAVLLYGGGPGSIGFELVAMTVLTGGLLALGIAVYRRTRMRGAGGLV
jgi:ABC-2 type transport system permease protein